MVIVKKRHRLYSVVPFGFDDVYDDLLQQVTVTGKLSVTEELWPPSSGDSWNEVIRSHSGHPFWSEIKRKSNIKGKSDGLSRPGSHQEKMQQAWEQQQLDRQREREELAQKQWQDEEQRRKIEAAERDAALKHAADPERWKRYWLNRWAQSPPNRN